MEQYELKAIAAQSCGLKTTISTSKDSGVFIPPELLSFLGLYDDTVQISFNIYKEDCLKALMNIIRSLPLFSSRGGVSAEVTYSFDFFDTMYNNIVSFFGEDEKKQIGPFTTSTTSQNRTYIYKWHEAGLNIRDLFVSGYTDLTFCKHDDGTTDLRFETRECRATSDISAVMMNTHYDEQTLQMIYFGAPGTGKSYSIKWLHGITDENSFRTTFHPDSDYSSFVGCYKPLQKHEDDKITYDFVPQVFTEAYIAAWRGYRESKPFFLIIEEINRGNCAQIFGDLFQLLDRNEKGFSEYKIKSDKDLEKYLQEEFSGQHKDEALRLEEFPTIVSGEELILPPNLNIIATMNTSDQSLFPIDSAFKRRWDWEYIPIQYEPKNEDGSTIANKIDIEGTIYDWGKFIKAVNKRIYDLTKSEDKELGYFFVRPDEAERITMQRFVSKVVFYLWSDIYKDYVGRNDSIFKFSEDGDEKNKVDHSFNSFFEDGVIKVSLVKSFIGQFEGVEDDGNDEDDESGSKRNQYLINGNGPFAGKELAFEAMKLYINNNPNKTPQEIVNEWNALGVSNSLVNNQTFVATTQFYRSKPVPCNDGSVWVTSYGWTFNPSPTCPTPTIPMLIQEINEKDWGINIEIIEQ